jgi:protein ImuB
MLWIALHLPALSLESFAATLGALRHALPLALLQGQRIAAVNRVALQLGVKPSFKRATALALAPQLRFGQADAAREAQALRAVVHAALAFTPMVALDGDAALPCVLLEVRGSLRYFGGLPSLQQRLRAALAPLGHSVRLASAPTAPGAALLARWRSGFELGAHVDDLSALRQRLDDAPVWLLGPGREHRDALQGMGLHTLGDLRRLPRSGLARRFGEALLIELDRARGDVPDLREALRPEPRFEARVELFERADSSEQLLHGAMLLLAQLVAWAQAQHARISGFTLAMRHERRHRGDTDTPEHTELALALAEASNDAQHLQLLLRERLARLPLA